MNNRDFYNITPIDVWKQILGDGLHYHFGFFEHPSDDFQGTLERAVRSFYGWIPDSSQVLDLGAGWGGPARMLSDEKACELLCVTSSDEQAGFIRQKGLAVVQADLEKPLPFRGRSWSTVLMLESLEHVRNKERLLAELRGLADSLVLRVSCTALGQYSGATVFGNSIVMSTPSGLIALLKKTGWQVRYVCNQRSKTWPSVLHWKKGLNKVVAQSGITTAHLMALNSLCDTALASPRVWIDANPLMDIVAY